MDVALINLKQIKHGYSKDNFDCTNTIYPIVLTYAGTHLLKPNMKIKEKAIVLDEILTKF